MLTICLLQYILVELNAELECDLPMTVGSRGAEVEPPQCHLEIVHLTVDEDQHDPAEGVNDTEGCDGCRHVYDEPAVGHEPILESVNPPWVHALEQEFLRISSNKVTERFEVMTVRLTGDVWCLLRLRVVWK